MIEFAGTADVTCYDIEGKPVTVPAESVEFRPAVYGILIEHDQVLLLRHPQTGLWQPPGCILSPQQTPAQALRHHFRRKTGMLPDLGPLLYIEDQNRVDEQGQAWCLSVLYYALERPATGPSALVSPADPPRSELISLSELLRSQMQFGYDAILAGQLRLALYRGL